MAYKIGFLSQKGGVGKSTLARLMAREVASGGHSVKIADMDTGQATCFHWRRRRVEGGIEPEIRVEQFERVKTALKEADNFDVYIFDGAPHASKDTLAIAKECDLIVIPTSLGKDDLDPGILLGHDMLDAGIPIKRIAYALVKTTDSEAEVSAARDYIGKAGYHVLDGEIPMRTAFHRAHDMGQALTETPFKSLSAKADELAQSMVDMLGTVAVGEAA